MRSGGYIGLGFGGMNAMSMLGAMMGGSFSIGGNMGWLADAADVCRHAGNRSLMYDGYAGMHAGRFAGSVGQCMRNITKIAQSIDTMFAEKKGRGRPRRTSDATRAPAQQPDQQPQKAGKKDQANKASGTGDSEEAKEAKAKKKAVKNQREASEQEARSKLRELGYDTKDQDRIIRGIEAKLAKDGNSSSTKAIKKAYEDGVKCWKWRKRTKEGRDKKGKPIKYTEWNKDWARESGEAWLRFLDVPKDRAKAIVKPLVQTRISTTKKPLNYMYLKREKPDGKYEVFTFVKGVGDAEQEYKGQKVYKRGKRWYTYDGSRYTYIRGSYNWHKIKSDDPTIAGVMVNLNGKKHPWTDQLTDLGKSYSAVKLIKAIEKPAGVDSDSDDGTVTGSTKWIGPISVKSKDGKPVDFDTLKKRVDAHFDRNEDRIKEKMKGAGRMKVVVNFKKGEEPKESDDDDGPIEKLKKHLGEKYPKMKFEIVKRIVDDKIEYSEGDKKELRGILFAGGWDGDTGGANTVFNVMGNRMDQYQKTNGNRLPYHFADAKRKALTVFMRQAKAMHDLFKNDPKAHEEKYKRWFDEGTTIIVSKDGKDTEYKMPGARKIFEKYFKDKLPEFDWKKPAPKPKKKPSGGGGGGGGGGTVFN
jgi:hypothetical protein